MDTAFRISLAISVVFHSSILTAMNGLNIPQIHKDDEKTVVVDYIRQEIIPEHRKQERVNSKTPVETQQVYIPQKALIAARDKELSPSPVKEKPAKHISSTDAVKQSKLVSSKDYISYNQIIRQKILSNLKRRYNERYDEGNVAVTFTLDSAGRFFGFDVDKIHSTGTSSLIEIASSSIREAAPFPPFPKSLAVPKMSFSLVIEFRKK